MDGAIIIYIILKTPLPNVSANGFVFMNIKIEKIYKY